MKIYCPKCGIGYQISDDTALMDKRRLKCSGCGEIFTISTAGSAPRQELPAEDALAMLHQAMNDEPVPAGTPDTDTGTAGDKPETEENIIAETTADEDDTVPQADDDSDDDKIDLEGIFERLSEHTEHLLKKEKELPVYEKVWLQIKNILGFHFKIKWHYLIAFAALFVLLSLFNNRYQIVREVPFLNGFYRFFGIQAKIPGEGLEFQNISWNFSENENGSQLEIKGFIYNTADKEIDIPLIHIEILDKNTVLLQSQNREIEEQSAESRTKLPLDLIIDNPAPTAKYIYLTFIEKD